MEKGRIKKPFFRFCINLLPNGKRCDKRFQPTGKWNRICGSCTKQNRINKIKRVKENKNER